MNLEFYDGKNDDSEIQYGRMGGKNESSIDDTCHGHLLVPEVENVYNVY